MNVRTRYFVTGGTGLIGKELVPRLLQRGGAVTLLVRQGSRDRCQTLIEGWQRLAETCSAMLQLATGDIEQPGLGLEASEPGQAGYDHVFHLAARYDLSAEESALQLTNVDGTRHLLAWLSEQGFSGLLHHVSSVAVAGDHKGLFRETDLELSQGFPHAYHRTKHESERLVCAASGRHRIYRPSAVVGHSLTGVMDRIDGPYYLFKAVQKARALPNWFPLIGLFRTPLNMVPVDYVAAALDHIAHVPDGDGKTFHLVDPSPPPFATTFNLLADAAGAPHIKATFDRAARNKLGAAMLGQLGALSFFRKQLLDDMQVPHEVARLMDEMERQRLRFDAASTTAALSDSTVRCPPQSDYTTALWDYWLRHLDPDRDRTSRAKRHLEDRVVLITGASGGIGAALAQHCSAAGAQVVLVARREKELAAVAESIRAHGGRASYFVADLSDMEACDRVVEQALEAHGRIDVLINNAAHSIRRSVVESIERFHDFERLMRINYFAPVRLIRGVLPGMRERRRGSVVNLVTEGVMLPSPNFGAYGATKAALAHLTGTAAAELLVDNIVFTAVYVPWVRTPMMDKSGQFAETNAMTPDEAAAWIVDGIVTGKRQLASGVAVSRRVAYGLAPATITRILSVLQRIWADDEKAHPEFAFDRMLLKQVVKGRMM